MNCFICKKEIKESTEPYVLMLVPKQEQLQGVHERHRGVTEEYNRQVKERK